MTANTNTTPIVGKLYCSSSQTVHVVRKRPHVVNGGGFVVMDSSGQRVLFRVDGCGGGIVEALSIYKKWKGYSLDYEGTRKLVFSLREPNSCLFKNKAIRIFTRNRGCDFKISGYFPDKCCSIVDSKGNEVAQVRVMKEVEELVENKDLYHVVVKPGMDQAFVFGVIAILDHIYGESTHC
ncbi:hypothetical protein DEO72_LG2g542 [Vigna unguiculata]|uniref:Protein LURP-one-related 6 n=1 Tax=Vigna unguiculata TaxID=3917 RepID=A0A4D6KZC1_VIGUN|nr:hypothetical protein DEO72_LG2g542 [Vigna unguiculata]